MLIIGLLIAALPEDGEHFEFHSVLDVFRTKTSHNVGYHVNIGSQHVERGLNHLNQNGGMSREALALIAKEIFWRLVDRKTKNYLGGWAGGEKSVEWKQTRLSGPQSKIAGRKAKTF
jgi:hypothetical protein